MAVYWKDCREAHGQGRRYFQQADNMKGLIFGGGGVGHEVSSRDKRLHTGSHSTNHHANERTSTRPEAVGARDLLRSPPASTTAATPLLAEATASPVARSVAEESGSLVWSSPPTRSQPQPSSLATSPSALQEALQPALKTSPMLAVNQPAGIPRTSGREGLDIVSPSTAAAAPAGGYPRHPKATATPSARYTHRRRYLGGQDRSLIGVGSPRVECLERRRQAADAISPGPAADIGFKGPSMRDVISSASQEAPKPPTNEEMKGAVQEWATAVYGIGVHDAERWSHVDVSHHGSNWAIHSFNERQREVSREAQSAVTLADRLSHLSNSELNHFGLRRGVQAPLEHVS